MDLLAISQTIQTYIGKVFPFLYTYVYRDMEDGSIFVSMNNSKIYYSEKYKELITKIKVEYLWVLNINNVFFIHEDSIKYFSHKFHFRIQTESTKFLNWEIKPQNKEYPMNTLNSNDELLAA